MSRFGAAVAGALMHPEQVPTGTCSSLGQEFSVVLQQHDVRASISDDCAQRSSVQQQKGMIIAIMSAIILFGLDMALLIVF